MTLLVIFVLGIKMYCKIHTYNNICNQLSILEYLSQFLRRMNKTHDKFMLYKHVLIGYFDCKTKRETKKKFTKYYLTDNGSDSRKFFSSYNVEIIF